MGTIGPDRLSPPAAAYERLTLPVLYVGTHQVNWLWSGDVGFPLFVSHRRLKLRKTLRPAVTGWALDSGGFTELSKFGRWTITPRAYCEAAARYDREIGRLEWCAIQDWMCEPGIVRGGRAGQVTAPGTGLTRRDHQRLTVKSYLDLTGLWPQYSDSEPPWMPVLQGWEPDDYIECADMYRAAGVNLADSPVVGIGSVCRRSSTREIADVVSVISALDLSSHWFGVKLSGVELGPVAQGTVRHGDGTRLPHGAASLDSMAWSFDARRRGPLDGCAHGSCANCPRYARMWRGRVMQRLRAAHDAHGGYEIETRSRDHGLAA